MSRVATCTVNGNVWAWKGEGPGAHWERDADKRPAPTANIDALEVFDKANPIVKSRATLDFEHFRRMALADSTTGGGQARASL